MKSKWQPDLRKIITKLYLNPDNSLEDVKLIMERDHDFFAGKSAYEKHLKLWKITKNKKYEPDHLKWLKINLAIRQKLEKKELVLYIEGKQVLMEDISKQSNRRQYQTLDLMALRSRTPPPGLVVLKPVHEQYLTSIKSRELPIEQFWRQVDMNSRFHSSFARGKWLILLHRASVHLIPREMIRIIIPVLWPENTPVVQMLFGLLPPEKQDLEDGSSTHLSKVFGNDHGVATNEFLKLAVYLLSNKHYGQREDVHHFSIELLKWMEVGHNIRFLRTILSCKTPTIDAFMEVIFFSALFFENLTIIKLFLDSGLNPDIVLQRGVLRKGKAGKFYQAWRLRPLGYAVEQCNTDMTILLLDNGANLNDEVSDRNTPLQIAARKGDLAIVEILLHRGAAVNSPGLQVSSALQNACLAGNFEIGKLLLENGANIDATDGDFGCPLECAIRKGVGSLIGLLLERGADIHCQPGDYGNTPLQSAAMVGDHELVKRLLLLNADPNSANGYYPQTALQQAAINGYLEICKILLDAGADINLAPEWDTCTTETPTALTAGVKSGCLQVVSLLLDRGADFDARRSNTTAIELAFKLNSTEIALELLAKGADPQLHSSLADAIERQNFELVEKLMECKADVSSIHFKKDPLCSAVYTGNESLVQQLLDRGFSPNGLENEHGPDGFRSPFCEAVGVLNFRMVNILLEAGAHINPSRYSTYTYEEDCNWRETLMLNPLQTACRRGNLEMVQHLMSRGADVNWPVRNETLPDGMTALQAAVASGSTETVEFLLMHKEIDLQISSSKENGKRYTHGGAALQTAVAKGREDLARMLLAHGASADDDTPSFWRGRTSLQSASRNGNVELVQLLLDYGADPNANAARYYGCTALQYACLNGHYSTVYLLLKNEADVNAPPCHRDGLTALQAAAQGGYLRIAQVLIDSGAHLNAPGSEDGGYTALEAAARNGRIDMVKLLLLAGADITETEFGRRQLKIAMELATRHGHDALAKFLEYSQIAQWKSAV